MAGWVKFDNGIGGHPKVLALSDDLYMGSLGLHLLSVCYCDQTRTDGFIPRKALRRISPVDCGEEVADLVRVGLWDATPDGYRIHGYLEWQRSAKEIDAASESARHAAYVRHHGSDDATRTADSNAPRIADGNAEQSRTDTDKNITEPVADSGAWKAFLTAYPKSPASGDRDRFHALTLDQQRVAVKAAEQYAHESAETEKRYRKGIASFLADTTNLDVLAARLDARLDAEERRRQERQESERPPLSDDEHAANASHARDCIASLSEGWRQR